MGLVLHCGAHEATLQEVQQVVTPEPQDKWFPIDHNEFVNHTTSALVESGMEVVDQKFGLWKGGDRFFGILELKSDRSDYTTIVGLRNSHDKKFRASLACGNRVFVCDNLSFSGEIVVGRKHTTNILRDLEQLTMKAVGKLSLAKVAQETRIDTYKDTPVTDAEADHLIMQAFRARAINVQRIAKVNQAWRNPEFDDFKERTAWSLFNAFTSALSGAVIGNFQSTPALHGLMDTHCGVPLAQAA